MQEEISNEETGEKKEEKDGINNVRKKWFIAETGPEFDGIGLA